MIAASTSGDGYWREGIGPLRGREQDSHENLVAGTPMLAFGGNNTSGSIDAATAVRAKGGSGHGDFESETFVVAADLRNGTIDGDTTHTVQVGGQYPSVDSVPHVIAFDTTQITHPENRSRPDDRSPQLSQSGHPPAVAFSQRTRGDDGRGYEREPNFVEEVSPTIEAIKPPSVVAFDCKAGGDTGFAIGDQAGALRGAGYGGGHAAVFKPSHYARDGKSSGAPADQAPPLTADADKGDQDPVLFTGAAVRRLTPVECERLQGFPDNYTLIKFRGKPAADGPRYRALGNSMAVPEVRWILTRIESFEGLK
jgi:DNA (cytosine-5)-methyltransferase 1